jgi:uncharacterized protein YndB with AHSA1/START domain
MSRQPFSIESSVSLLDSTRLLFTNAENTLEINRIFRIPRATLFQYFVTPDKLTEWMVNSVDGTLERGSYARLVWNQETEVEVCFDEITPNRSIRLRMLDTQSVSTRVHLNFHRHERYSYLLLNHVFPDDTVDQQQILNLRRKWTFFLDNLASVCEHKFDLRPLKAEEDGWEWLKF